MEYTIKIPEDKFPDMKMPAGTAQQKRMNRKTGVYFDSANILKARNFYTTIFYQFKFRNHITEAYKGPTIVKFEFEHRTTKKAMIGKPKLTRPDCDNAVKLIIDCLIQSGIIADDNQIYDLQIVKRWAKHEALRIYINGETE